MPLPPPLPSPPPSPAPLSETLHATAVAIGGRGVVILGPSGSGKSDLALRLIDRGAMLVSDDRTRVEREGERLIARAPERMAGRIEVRGLGIALTPHLPSAPVGLVIELATEEQRLPEPRERTLAGVSVREIAIDPFRASAPIKVEWALRQPELPGQ